ncbi:MAG: hypothetical protein IRY89_14860 [Pseudolabrys sp.]|nr:hypothetical protein [Pseudolabrys sp.]
MAAISVTVATPAFGEVFYTPYVQSLLQLQRAMHERRWTMRHLAVSYAHVNEARNYLLTHWYDKSDSSHLLFVDADMGFEPRLVLDMIAFDKPVVGVLYTKRQIDLRRLVAAAKVESEARAIARAHDFIVRPLRGRPPRRQQGFLEVAACGTGVMLIKREAIATLLERLPQVSEPTERSASPLSAGLARMIRAFDNIAVDGQLLVNDFAFCHRWHALCEGEIWARADQAVTHIGLHRFAARYVDAAGAPRIALVPEKPTRAPGDGASRFKPRVIAGRLPLAPKGKPRRP